MSAPTTWTHAVAYIIATLLIIGLLAAFDRRKETPHERDIRLANTPQTHGRRWE